MKKIMLYCIFFLAVFSSQAQNNEREEHREKIKAMKVAFFTQELEMSPEMAQKFWPVYNRYECLRRDLHQREDVDLNLRNIEALSEAKAEEMLEEYLAVEKEEFEVKKDLFEDLKELFTAKEIIKLHKVESDFNRKLMREYRERKAAANRNN